MKFVALVLAVCIASCCQASTLTDEQRAKLREYKEACITESGVDAAVVEAIIKGGPITREAKLDCFSSCLLQKIGVQRPDGSIDRAVVEERAKSTHVDIEKFNAVAAKCRDITGKDACEIGGAKLECFIKEKTFPVLD